MWCWPVKAASTLDTVQRFLETRNCAPTGRLYVASLLWRGRKFTHIDISDAVPVGCKACKCSLDCFIYYHQRSHADPLGELQLPVWHVKYAGCYKQTVAQTKISENKLIFKTCRWKTQPHPKGKINSILVFKTQARREILLVVYVRMLKDLNKKKKKGGGSTTQQLGKQRLSC